VGGLDAECNSFVRRGDSAPARPSFDGCDTPEVGVIFATDDGGHTWQRRYYRQVDMNRPPITAAHLYSISCPSQTTCFAAGHNIVVKSVDGGQTWRLATKNPILQSSPNQFGSQVALSLTCPSVTTCWASLGVPTLARTDDGGVTWTAVPAHPKPRAGFVSAVTCPTLATCYAVGGAGLIMRLGPGGSAHVTRMRAFRTLHRDSAAGSTG
jgi:photosystem II stability/assembly factor-like uncharacterized protein